MYRSTVACALALGGLPMALLPGAAAQDLPSTLAGCKDVSCPTTNGGGYTCTVADDSFDGVGLTRIADAPRGLEGLTLVKGVSVQAEGPDEDKEDKDREFKSVYYLGLPADVAPGALDDGCAVVFRGVAPPFSTDGNRKTTQGTCADSIQRRCIDALTDRLRRLGGANATCANVEDALREPPVTGCGEMLENEQGLGPFRVAPLADLRPVTEARNGSSDCWPVLPKTDGLAEIANFTVEAGYDSEALHQIMFGVSPVLTVFFDNNQTTAQMTCVKVIEDIEEKEEDESAAAMVSYHPLVAVSAFSVMLWSL